MEMLEREKAKMAPPTLASLPTDRGSSPSRISGPLEIDRDKCPQRDQVTDYFADDLH